jgi:hypothetical protein|tara:strand:+ start:1390 stop:1788 length:399 start_codon:yes stop_codon:yes gene_type:complete
MKNIKELLFRSYSTELTSEEGAELKSHINKSDQIKKEKDQLDMIVNTITNMVSNQFSREFEDQILNKINSKSWWTESLYNELFSVFKPVAFASSIAIIGLVYYQVYMGDILTINSLIGIPEYTIENILALIQ